MVQIPITMKRKLLIMAMMCCSTVLFSQIRIDWQQCYGSMKDDEAVSLMAKDGGYYVVGRVEKGGGNGMVECDFADDIRTWLIEIDNEGNLKNQMCMDFGSSNIFGVMGEDSAVYLVGGYRVGGIARAGVVKMTTEGDILWQRSYGSPDQSFWYGPRATPTADGGLVFSLVICFSGGDISQYYGFWDTWVVKLDSEGNIEWETTIGTEGEERGRKATPCQDGTYCVPGYGRNMRGNGSVPNCNVSHDYVDGLVVWLSAEGDITDSRCYGGSLHDSFTTVIPLEDGWLFGGSTQSVDGDLSGAGFHNGLSANGYLTSDIWLMRTDADGNILWSRCYGGSQYEFVGRIFQNEDGGFTVFGTTYSYDGDVQSGLNLYNPNFIQNSVLWVFRIDGGGNLLWERAVGTVGGPVYFGDVIKESDKEYTVVATPDVYSNPQYMGDFNCSNIGLCSSYSYWVLHITDVFDYDGVEETPLQENDVRVYPNPASTWLAIDYTLPSDHTTATVEIANTLGVKVLQKQLNGHEGQSVVDLRGLANGVYTLTVMCGEYVLAEKLVISR